MAERFFNTSGPVVAADHYSIPPLQRFDLDEILRLIGAKRYFLLHAPRQTGKTSALLALRDLLNEGGEYRCVYANVETGQTARGDVAGGMTAILSELRIRARITLPGSGLEDLARGALADAGAHGALREVLVRWSTADPKPLVLLLDEIDALVGDTLISTLRQLRAGYDMRPAAFPQSVILCGIRDVRDYRIHSESGGEIGEIIAGGSAFNIKAKSLRLGDLDQADVRALLGQHTEETGQEFTEGALAAAWNLSRGQPWLVNALAYQACFETRVARDRSRTIDEEAIMDAREELVLGRQTHLHQLADKLREERVRRVVEPMLSGADAGGAGPDDVEYVRDLGLLARRGTARIANPVYREVIPRELNYAREAMILQRPRFTGASRYHRTGVAEPASRCQGGWRPDTVDSVFVYWDNSNIFIGAQAEAEEREGPSARYRVRVNFRNMMKLASADRPVEKAVAAGSVPPELRALWNRLSSEGVNVELVDRGAVDRGEQQGPDRILQLQMLRDFADYNGDTGVAVVLTGDGQGFYDGAGFHADLERMHRRGWRVEVISWAKSCNQRMRGWVEENGVFIPLDDYYEAVTFLTPSSPDYPTADPRESAVLELSGRPRAQVA